MFEPKADSAEMPFCSIRCKMADLNRWFEEEIGLPVLESDEDEEEDGEPPQPPTPREWSFE
jgi:endogenous inhibitor of DNA gyrase (YacG/DUF329 family)